MSDELKDLFPIDVEFQDGESPAPKKLNTWADQTESAFLKLQRLIGDAYHTQVPKAEEGFLVNLTRNLGNMGRFQHRIPSSDTFRYRQTLTDGEREHILDFLPKNAGAATFSTNVPNNDTQNACITSDGVGGWQDPSNNYKASESAFDIDTIQWTRDGKRLFTGGPGAAGQGGAVKYVEYEVDASVFFEGYHARNGANVVPSLAQIDQNVTGAGPAWGDTLATVTDQGVQNGLQTYRIALPEIKHYYDRQGNLVDLTTKLQTSPKYTVPGFWTTELSVVAGGAIPSNMIRIWQVDYNAAGSVTSLKPIRNEQNNSPITYTYVDQYTFDMHLPSGMNNLTFKNEASPNNREFIVTFAGLSIGAVLELLVGAMREHSHSLTEDGAPVKHKDIVGGYDDTKYGASGRDDDYHKQYLHRSGYDSGGNENGSGAMLGDLMLGSRKILAGTVEDANEFGADDSFKLLLGSTTKGLYYNQSRGMPALNTDLWLEGDGVGNNVNLIFAGDGPNAKRLQLIGDPDGQRLALAGTNALTGSSQAFKVGALELHPSGAGVDGSYIYWKQENDASAVPWQNNDIGQPAATANWMRYTFDRWEFGIDNDIINSELVFNRRRFHPYDLDGTQLDMHDDADLGHVVWVIPGAPAVEMTKCDGRNALGMPAGVLTDDPSNITIQSGVVNVKVASGAVAGTIDRGMVLYVQGGGAEDGTVDDADDGGNSKWILGYAVKKKEAAETTIQCFINICRTNN